MTAHPSSSLVHEPKMPVILLAWRRPSENFGRWHILRPIDRPIEEPQGVLFYCGHKTPDPNGRTLVGKRFGSATDPVPDDLDLCRACSRGFRGETNIMREPGQAPDPAVWKMIYRVAAARVS